MKPTWNASPATGAAASGSSVVTAHPPAAAGVGFGAVTALQFVFQSLGLDVPYQLFLVLPYMLTLLALAGAVGRTRPPADLGKEPEPA